MLDNITYWLSASTKITSMSCGNQKGWVSNLATDSPLKINS